MIKRVKNRKSVIEGGLISVMVFLAILEAIIGLDKLCANELFSWIDHRVLVITIAIIYLCEIVLLIASFYMVIPKTGRIPDESRLQVALGYIFLNTFAIVLQIVLIMFILSDNDTPTAFYWMWVVLIPVLLFLDNIVTKYRPKIFRGWS